MIDPNQQGGNSNAAYDGGQRPIVTVVGAPSLNASGFTAIAAAPGLRTKILGYNIYPSAFTSEGTLILRDGTGGATLFNVARFTALGQRADFNMGGQVICQGSVNTLIEIFYTGNAFIQFSLIYYQAA